MQRLLNHASWDTFAAMGVVRRFAVAGLEEAARGRRRRGLVIGAIDETGQEKAGEATCGVKRQYLGCAGRVANGINTVHLSYVRDKTRHALIGARQWIPREHLEDPVKSLLMGLPLACLPHQGTAGHRHLPLAVALIMLAVSPDRATRPLQWPSPILAGAVAAEVDIHKWPSSRWGTFGCRGFR